MIIWIIGLSGSGKTTLANEVATILRSKNKKVVLIDGDQIRELYGNDLGHDLKDRKKNADRINNICEFLDKQDIDVVCAILSLFPESRDRCRKNLKKYFEVYIDADIKTLKKRDTKGLYEKFEKGERFNVAGLDLDFPKPNNPDLVIENNKSKKEFLEFADKLANIF